MARTNERGLELSFKRYTGQTRGRWFKTINGKEVYFGSGTGISDRASYRSAVAKLQEHTGQAKAAREAAEDKQKAFEAIAGVYGASPADKLAKTKAAIAVLAKVSPAASEVFAAHVEQAERQELLKSLATLPVSELRTAKPVPEGPAIQTVASLMSKFVAHCKQRVEFRKKIETMQANGMAVKDTEEGMGDGRYVAILRDEKAFRACCGNDRWDGTEATAHRIAEKYRDASKALFLNGTHAPGTFNERIKFMRQFLGWCEAQHFLDHLPRDRRLFAKVEYKPDAKSMPLDELCKLWDGGSAIELTWLLLALNCDYYAKDLSDLTVEMVSGGYVDHTRAKTAVNVKYKLWPETQKHLNKLLPTSGPVFRTEDNTPLVHYRPSKKDKDNPIRIDNVRNHFYRLCETVGVPTGKAGYSFSNIRDTASTEVEKINPAFTDLFCAHRDDRMARFYVDGKHVDTSGLDAVIDKLQAVFRPLWHKKARKKITADRKDGQETRKG